MDQKERTLASLVHLLSFAGLIVPFGHVLGPLVLWLVKRNDYPGFFDTNGKESVNFQISMTLYLFVAGVLLLALIGILLLPAVIIVDIVLVIIAAVKANQGELYRYPLAIRFIG